MPKPKKPAPEFDVTSAEPIVFYTGPGLGGDVPAADLSANALARIAWIRGGQKGSPADVNDTAIAALRDELTATGNYAAKPPASPATTEEPSDE